MSDKNLLSDIEEVSMNTELVNRSTPDLAPVLARSMTRRKRQIGNRIAHQLPGNQCIPDFGFDFNARVSQAVPRALPYISAAQHKAEQFASHFAHVPLDAFAKVGCGSTW